MKNISDKITEGIYKVMRSGYKVSSISLGHNALNSLKKESYMFDWTKQNNLKHSYFFGYQIKTTKRTLDFIRINRKLKPSC